MLGSRWQQRHMIRRQQLQQHLQQQKARAKNETGQDDEWSMSEPKPSQCLVGRQAYVNCFRSIELNKQVRERAREKM